MDSDQLTVGKLVEAVESTTVTDEFCVSGLCSSVPSVAVTKIQTL